MIRIVRTRTLAALQARAAEADGLSERAAADAGKLAAEAAARRAREAQSEAEAALASSEAELAALWDDTVAGLARLEAAAGDPQAGSPVQGGIALRFLRGQIEKIKKSGDLAMIDGIRALDALIGADSPPAQGPGKPSAPAQNTADAAAPIKGRSPGCICPMPYAPGMEVPCAAAGRCLDPSIAHEAAAGRRD